MADLLSSFASTPSTSATVATAPKAPTPTAPPVTASSYKSSLTPNNLLEGFATGTTQAPTKPAPAVVTAAPATNTVNKAQQTLTTANQNLQTQSQNNAAVAQQKTVQAQTDAQNKTLADATAALTSTGTQPPTPPTSPTDQNQPAQPSGSQQYTDQLTADEAQNEQAYNDYKNQVSQLQNGTFPLTPSQQSQVDALQKKFDVIKAQQEIANRNFTSGTTQIGITKGLNRYAPQIAQGEIQAAINSGIQKIADIESQASDAVSKLQQGFETQDFDMISKAYEAYSSYVNQKDSTLKSMISEVDAKEKDLRDYNYKVTQDAVDNAFKAETFNAQQDKNKFDEMMASNKFNADQKQQIQDNYFKAQDLAINKAKLNLDVQKQAFDEGQITGAEFAQSAADLPGVKTLSNIGAQYFDPTQFSDKKQASAAENAARKAGIPILSDAKDREAVTAISTALQNIDSIQQSFSQLASSGVGGATFSNISNPLSKAFDTNYGSLLKAYQQNRDILFQQISTLAGSHPRLNAQELTAAANALPTLNEFNHDTLKDGINKLNMTRQYLNNSLSSIIPDRVYSTVDDYVKSNPIQGLEQINKIRAEYPTYTPDEVMQIINGGNNSGVSAGEQGSGGQPITQKLSTAFPAGSEGGQCGFFAHKIISFPSVGDTFQEKVAAVSKYGIPASQWKQSPKVGDVLILKGDERSGHVAVVNQILPNGKVQLTESNYSDNEKVTHNRQLALNDARVIGAIRGTLKV